MPRIIAQVSFPDDGAMPKDVTTNTWHFVGQAYNDNAYAEVVSQLAEFYKVAAPGVAVQGLLGSMISTEARIKLYRADDPPKRVPVSDVPMAIAASSTCLPPEVAVCLSFRGALESGAPQARRRGRIFIGPMSAATSDNGKVSTTTREAIATAAFRLANRGTVPFSDVNQGVHWVAYSPTADTFTTVVAGWVDDAFDTQRRRGRDPITRTAFAVA